VLDRHWRATLAALFAIALGWRLAYLSRLLAGPLASTLRGDERTYWDWSTFLLSHGFRGTNALFQGPLYPYLLAFTRLFTGSSIGAVLAIQAVLGSTSVILLADAARRLTRPVVAIGIGCALALYQMSVMFDGLILAESLAFLLESALIWLWCRRPVASTSWGAFMTMGAFTGLLANVRGTALLLLVPTMWLATKSRASVRRPLASAVAVLAGGMLFVLPSLAWNWHASREFIPLTYNFGYNLYVGNNPQADGGFVQIAGGSRMNPSPASHPDGGAEGDGREFLRKSRGLDLSPSQSSAYWTRQAFAFIANDPGRVAQLVGAKLLMMWNGREVTQLESAELFRREAGPLGIPIAGTFFLFGTIGLIGLAFVEAAPIAGIALRGYVLAIVLGLAPFFVTDRYRYHLIPALAVLGALAVETTIRRWGSREYRSLGELAAVGVAGLLLVALPLPGQSHARDQWDIARELGTRWLDQGRPDLAFAEYQRAIAMEERSGIGVDDDPATRRERARLHFNYAVTLHALGRNEEEMHWLESAAREDPDNSRYARTLADAYELVGRREVADSLLRRLSSLVGGEPEALVSAGWQAAREGRKADAESLFRASVQSDQRQYGAWGALVRVEIERARWSSAESSLAAAERSGMPRATLLAHKALLYAAWGDTARARAALRALPPESIANNRLLSAVVAEARALLTAKIGH
jgi:tetratricopeptide (TPR) repeat protein